MANKDDKIQGFEKAKAEAVQVEKVVGNASQKEWKLSDEDIARIRAKLEEEQKTIMTLGHLQLQMGDAARRANLAKKEREQICVELEKKLEIPKGTVWVVDFEKKVIRKRV